MAVLRKENSHSVVISRLIKEKKLIQTLIFPTLASTYEVLTGRMVYSAYHRTFITPTETEIGRYSNFL